VRRKLCCGSIIGDLVKMEEAIKKAKVGKEESENFDVTKDFIYKNHDPARVLKIVGKRRMGWRSWRQEIIGCDGSGRKRSTGSKVQLVIKAILGVVHYLDVR
jgi:hypothetical protein